VKPGTKSTREMRVIKVRTAPNSISENKALRVSAILGLMVLSVYVLTLYPSVSGGDSGEFIAASYTWGIVHPPGYPLYTLLGKLFTFIPIGTIAWRVNLLSAICGSLAAFFLSQAVMLWSENPWAGLLAGGLFAFSPLVWTYATQAEVFSLNNLFVALLLYLLVRFNREGSLKWVFIGAFVSGLGLSNHHTLILYIIPIAIWVGWLQRDALKDWRNSIKIVGLFFLGLTPYLYLPIAAVRLPLVSWGRPDTLAGFITHITRAEYGSFKLVGNSYTPRTFGLGLLRYLSEVPKEFLYFGGIVAGIGLIWGFSQKKQRGLFLLTLSGVLFYLFIFEWLGNIPFTIQFYGPVFVRFWQQPNLILFAWIGIGYAAIHQRLKAHWSGAGAGIGVAIALVALQLGLHYRAQDQHHNWTVNNYGHAVLEPLPENSLYLSRGDLQINVIHYLQQCEKVRTDVIVLDRILLAHPWMNRIIEAYYPNIRLPGKTLDEYGLKQLVDANREGHSVFAIALVTSEDEPTLRESYDLIPRGLVYQWIPKLASNENKLDRVGTFDEVDRWFKPLEVLPFRKGVWEEVVFNDYTRARFDSGSYLINEDSDKDKDPKVIEKAISLLEPILSMNLTTEPSIYKILAIAHTVLAQKDRAENEKALAMFQEYVRVAPSEDQEVPAIKRLLATANSSGKDTFVMPKLILKH
jgi:hypothetical protein